MTWPDIRHTYDVVAADYAAAFADELAGKPFDTELLDAYAEAVGEPVLDVGCGPAGHVTSYLAGRGVQIEGLDVSAAVVAEATRRNPGLQFWLGDLRSLPADDGALAGLVSFYSVVHLPRAEWPGALAEFHRVLVPGGLLLLAVHGGTGETAVHGWFGHPVEIRTTLVGLDELTDLVTGAGLDVLRRYERAPYPGEYPSLRLYVLARRP